MNVYVVKSMCDGVVFDVCDSYSLALDVVQSLIDDWCTMSGEHIELSELDKVSEDSTVVTAIFGNVCDETTRKRVFSINKFQLMTREIIESQSLIV